LTAAGAGAESRKVIGMAVFSGMLIATILGVCLIPMLFVIVERITGGGHGGKAEAAPVPPPAPAHGAGGH
jgi:HAE1 family hydrophobic/amphiphilic exporter-1